MSIVTTVRRRQNRCVVVASPNLCLLDFGGGVDPFRSLVLSLDMFACEGDVNMVLFAWNSTKGLLRKRDPSSWWWCSDSLASNSWWRHLVFKVVVVTTFWFSDNGGGFQRCHMWFFVNSREKKERPKIEGVYWGWGIVYFIYSLLFYFYLRKL